MQSLIIYDRPLREVKAKSCKRIFLSPHFKTFNILNNLLSGREEPVFYALNNYIRKYIKRVALFKRYNVIIIIISLTPIELFSS
jgi:hypothetical protein